MVSLLQEAVKFESICEMFETADELDPSLLDLFKKGQEDLASEVDRMFRCKMYAESQLELTKKQIFDWQNRKRKMEKFLSYIKETAMLTAESTKVPLKGVYGKITVQKNSQPTLELSTHNIPEEYFYKEYVLNKESLRNDLLAGKEIDGASLTYGYHPRFTKG